MRLPAVEEPFNELQTAMVLWADTWELYNLFPNKIAKLFLINLSLSFGNKTFRNVIKLGKICHVLCRTCLQRVEASCTDTWKGTMQSSSCHLAEGCMAAQGKTKAGKSCVGGVDTFSDETWPSLRKGTLERLSYFGREGQVQKYKKRIRNNFLFTVPHAGPGLRATSQSYHQNPSQRNPPRHQDAG